jgi:hypothetical protein
MKDIIGKIDQNFIVAAFIPSLAFATFFLFIFGPIIPQQIESHLRNTLAPLDQPVLLLLMVTMVLGFSLYSLNIYIYKVIEGYFILNRFPLLQRYQQRKVLKQYCQIKRLEHLIDHFTNVEAQRADEYQIQVLKQRLYQLSARYQLHYPLAPQLIMPTRFGNVMRAMESYPRERYQMDAVILWPRLLHVIPDKYYQKLNQSNNSLAFLINCSILSFGLAFASGLAAGYQALLLNLAQNGRPELLYFIMIDTSTSGLLKYTQNTYIYLVIVVIMMVLFALFYRAAIPIAIQYGNLVRSAFDLFRWHLIKALHLKWPTDYDEETTQWDNLSMFFGHGPLNDYMIPFDYSHSKGETSEGETGDITQPVEAEDEDDE